MSGSGIALPAAFAQAVRAARAAVPRRELTMTEITAPQGLAPHAFALAADVTPTPFDPDADVATGRLVLLHDPAEPEAWLGAFRIVCYAQAPVDVDLATDPLMADVVWSWLVDALALRGAAYRAESGTATKAISSGFGELGTQPLGATVELRASWTPIATEGAVPDMHAHVEAWGELLCMLAGLPPTGDGVSSLTAKRNAHG
ncbi:MAG: DUF3000 domain-containing protein [Microbacterium sp.]|nr:DUF3000 domain-containing protein [Microbacterium sp.]